MVGQDDEAVRPRRLLGRPEEAADRPVEAVEGIDRLGRSGPTWWARAS